MRCALSAFSCKQLCFLVPLPSENQNKCQEHLAFDLEKGCVDGSSHVADIPHLCTAAADKQPALGTALQRGHGLEVLPDELQGWHLGLQVRHVCNRSQHCLDHSCHAATPAVGPHFPCRRGKTLLLVGLVVSECGLLEYS